MCRGAYLRLSLPVGKWKKKIPIPNKWNHTFTLCAKIIHKHVTKWNTKLKRINDGEHQ